MADKPITRKEYFLAKAGGQDVKTPEPITREEQFLDAIVKNSGGGGLPAVTDEDNGDVLTVVDGVWDKAAPGGGGSGLPPITTETVEVVAEQTVTGFQNMGGIYVGMGGEVDFSDLADGDAVDVVFDGVTYHTHVVSLSGIVAIGNGGIMGDGEDTGEPFALTDAYQPDTLAVITNQAGSSHTVAASASVSSPKSGSILIVDSGDWKAEELSELLPFAVGVVMASGAFTVPANSAYVMTDMPITAVLGVPSSWNIGTSMGVTRATNGNHDTTDVLIVDATFDFANNLISFANFFNPTSSAVTFSGIVFSGGIAKNY